MGEVTAKPRKGRKPAKTLEATVTAQCIKDILERVDVLERKQRLVTEGYEFVANETRNLFGFGAIAQIFDAIFEKLNK